MYIYVYICIYIYIQMLNAWRRNEHVARKGGGISQQ